MKMGYFFIVTGERYRNELLYTLKELRKHTKLPICVASDQNPGFDCDAFQLIHDPKFSFQDKVQHFPKTPFDYTVYLDSDISFFHSPDAIFEGLEGADLLASHEASLGLGHLSRKAEITEVFPEVSTGLVAYKRTSAIEMLFKNWSEEYDWLLASHRVKEDQPAFRRALFKTNVKFSILPPEFHYIPANFTRLVGPKVYCIHNHNFDFARKLGNEINARPMGDYSAYVDGLGVFRNPYAMNFKEILNFNMRCIQLLPYLLLRAGYIAIKQWFR